jgi:hypothetical protein
MRDTRPTVFSLNVADGLVRGRPTAVLEAQPDEAYYADEFGVQISRPVRAEVASELGGSSSAYVEPDAAPAAPPPLNRHASDAFRSYAMAAMYRSADGDSSSPADAPPDTFGLCSAMPSIFTLDPARLTTRELTNMIDFDADMPASAAASRAPKF